MSASDEQKRRSIEECTRSEVESARARGKSVNPEQVRREYVRAAEKADRQQRDRRK